MKLKSSKACNRRRLPLLSRLPLLPVFAVLLIPFFAGCSGDGGDPRELSLPQTPILSAGPEWAVVEEPYVRLFREPTLTADVLGYERQGSVLVVESQTNYTADVKGTEDHWYLVHGEVSRGWAFGSHLKLFVSRDRADNAATLYER